MKAENKNYNSEYELEIGELKAIRHTAGYEMLLEWAHDRKLAAIDELIACENYDDVPRIKAEIRAYEGLFNKMNVKMDD